MNKLMIMLQPKLRNWLLLLWFFFLVVFLEFAIEYSMANASKQANAIEFRRALFHASLSSVLTILFFSLWKHILTRDVKSLILAVKGLSSGDLSVRIGMEGKHDFAKLGQALDRMAENLEEKQKQLRTSELLWKSVFECAPYAIVINRLRDGAYLEVNPAFEAATGYRASDIIGKSHPNMLAPNEAENRRQAMEQLIREGRIDNWEANTLNKAGMLRHILYSSVLIKMGDEPCCVSLTVDITERKKVEKELERHRLHLEDLVRERTACLEKEIHDRVDAQARLAESELRMLQLFERSPIGLFYVDESGIVRQANDRSISAFGSSREKLVGFDCLKSIVNKPLNQAISQAIQGEETAFEGEYTSITGSRTFIAAMRMVPLKTGQPPNAVIICVEDITERKRMQEALVIARDHAEAGNRAKSEFLSNISHEIRTPLTAILGYSKLLIDDPNFTEQNRRFVEIISNSGKRLLELINEVLDMAKIEAGRLVLGSEPLDLPGLIRELSDMFQPQMQAKGLTLQFQGLSDMPERMQADAGKVRQVIANLLSNALKYTDKGRISVTCGTSAFQGNRMRVEVRVQDTGCGIAAVNMKNIFDPFWQAEDAKFRGMGTGLGMPISQRLARLMGGDITVTSELGNGSEFVFAFMAGTVEESVGSISNKPAGKFFAPASRAKYMRILIVDDQPAIRKLLRLMLKRVGFLVQEASNGNEALQMYEIWKPHAIIMDIAMPKIDGIKAIQRIRNAEKGEKTYIAALTASIFDENREKVMEAGADAFFCKPYDETELLDSIGKALHIEFQYAPSSSGVSTQPKMPDPGDVNIALIPEQLLHKIRQTVQEGEAELLKVYLGEAAACDVKTARHLQFLAQRYLYDELLQILSTKDQHLGF